ncbi:MAG: hypothetical protein U0R52_03390 [Solirubrobacterales bacterium]
MAALAVTGFVLVLGALAHRDLGSAQAGGGSSSAGASGDDSEGGFSLSLPSVSTSQS